MIKVLLDTDLGSDCDDAGALAVLHRLADEKRCEIKAVTHCASEISGAVAVRAINDWYKRGDIPIGRYDTKTFLENDVCRRYIAPIAEKYLENHDMPQIENAVRVMRKTLAAERDITLVVIGMMNNIAELMKSEGDDISPLSGTELINQSVSCMYVMGGHFGDLSYAEYNILKDIESAQYVSQNFPKPVCYSGFELGDKIITGKRLEAEPEDNPVRFAYRTWNKFVWKKEETLRSSWDPITAYCAVVQNSPLYIKSTPKTITFDDEGRVLMSDGGKDCYLIAKRSDEEIRAALDELLH